jgi:hypothetical protein
VKHFFLFTTDGYDFYRIETHDGAVYFNAAKNGMPAPIAGGYPNIKALMKLKGIKL